MLGYDILIQSLLQSEYGVHLKCHFYLTEVKFTFREELFLLWKIRMLWIKWDESLQVKVKYITPIVRVKNIIPTFRVNNIVLY